MNTVVIADFSHFGFRELQDAAALLVAYADHKGDTDFLGDDLTVNFNTYSGIVFLSDAEYNVGVLKNGVIVQFFSCMQCGYEGTQEDTLIDDKDFVTYNGYCSKACEEQNT